MRYLSRRFLEVTRPLPWLAALALLAGAALAACQHSSSQAPGGAGGSASSSASTPPSEAQRTQEMEKKAKDINQQARDIQSMQGTEQEKIDAVNKLEQQRQDLTRQSEGAPADSSSTPPPQPPPQ
jgi:TolA-binding protein